MVAGEVWVGNGNPAGYRSVGGGGPTPPAKTLLLLSRCKCRLPLGWLRSKAHYHSPNRGAAVNGLGRSMVLVIKVHFCTSTPLRYYRLVRPGSPYSFA